MPEEIDLTPELLAYLTAFDAYNLADWRTRDDTELSRLKDEMLEQLPLRRWSNRVKRFYGRTDWHAHPPTRPLDSQGSPTEVFIHHTENDDAGLIDTLPEQIRAMQGIQTFHQHGRGWSDVAYHAIVFQPQGKVSLSRVFLGRRPDQVPAAQLNHNAGTLAIAVYGDFRTDTVDRNTRYAIEQAIRKLAPGAKTLGGHRDVVATQCPGDRLYRELDRIAQATGLERYRR